MKDLKKHFPLLSTGTIVNSSVCLYTMTPDEDFIIDYHPNTNNNVIIASPCSGHGFKFCVLIGKIIANMTF